MFHGLHGFNAAYDSEVDQLNIQMFQSHNSPSSANQAHTAPGITVPFDALINSQCWLSVQMWELLFPYSKADSRNLEVHVMTGCVEYDLPAEDQETSGDADVYI